MNDLNQLTATDAVRALHTGQITPFELIDAAEQRHTDVDERINALPTTCFDRAREHARHLPASDSSNLPQPWLAGLPVAIKDLTEVAGVRCTYGSSIFADNIARHSDLVVERLERHGALVVAKSNTPEFGAGASTFNDVFGFTHNPFDLSRSVAGSSGGSAAALASGQVWGATGTDLGGSLRIPASFNSVVGLRPSPGRIAHGPHSHAFDTLNVTGPMARTVADVALLLDAMAGFDDRDPLSFDTVPGTFTQAVSNALPPLRIAYSDDLGITPVADDVVHVTRKVIDAFSAMETEVIDSCPDFSEAISSFQVLRASAFAAGLSDHLKNHRDQLKPEVVWNIEKGLKLTADDIGQAEAQRTRLFNNVTQFFNTVDLLVCPTSAVTPFPVETRYIDEINGHKFENYVDWVAITFAITLTGCPALSLPVGFSADGLPVGVQIIGPPRGEARLLAMASMLEETLAISHRVPHDSPALRSTS